MKIALADFVSRSALGRLVQMPIHELLELYILFGFDSHTAYHPIDHIVL